METAHITAEWARKTASEKIGIKVQAQIDNALQTVAKAVERNDFYSTFQGPLDDIAKQELSKRGFKIEYVTGDYRDPSYYMIKW